MNDAQGTYAALRIVFWSEHGKGTQQGGADILPEIP